MRKEYQLSPIEQKKYKEILLQTFKAFVEFCNVHNLKYVASHGTMLGAVRHQGLIPWDDDIDVYMPRKDYDRMLNLKNNMGGIPYEIKDFHDDYILPYAKFMDANSTIWEKQYEPIILGVFIDVFPLDELNDTDNNVNPQDFVGLWLKFSQSFRNFSLKRLCEAFFNKKRSECIDELKHLQYYGRHSYYLKLLDDMTSCIRQQHGDMLVSYGSALYDPKNFILKKEWMNDIIDVPFEDCTIKIPRDYDSYLKSRYGDYMIPPKKEQQVSWHYHYYMNLERRDSISEIKKLLQE